MARRSGRVVRTVVTAAVVTTLAVASSAGAAGAAPAQLELPLPPPSVQVSYADATVLADCSANGIAGIYLVTGQAASRLPLLTASVRCTVNGMPTLAALPTLNGLLGSAVPLLGVVGPLLAPAPTETALGFAVAVTAEVTICLVLDTTLTVPLLPPIRRHIETCSTA